MMNSNRRKKAKELITADISLTAKQVYELTKGIKGKRKTDEKES